MATYINPDAVKDSSIAKSKLDTALANEINEKLTDAPKDGKVYDRSDGEWIEDEDGAVYELIEDITLEEAVQKIVRTTEPDGTPYNFKRMMVYIHKPTTAFMLSYRQVFHLNRTYLETYPFAAIMANVSESHESKAICKVENGYWDAIAYYRNNNGVGNTTLGLTDAIEKTDNYDRIIGYSASSQASVLFEVGTNIKIYGIR